MKRRDFIKGAVITSAVLSSTRVFSSEYERKGEKKLNRLTNRESPSILEQKHVPVMELPKRIQPGSWFDVHIKVGFMKEHPSTPDHWITKIKLLVDGKKVAKTKFESGGISAPVAVFRIRIKRDSTLEAVEHCNLHGTWISDPAMVKVT
jgi:superoxide reductase